MDLSDITAFSEDQNRGHWFDLLDPVTGKATTGIRLKIAGPDSEVQRRARLKLADDLAEQADEDGRVSAEVRERLRLASLARCILDWEITEEGKPLKFSHSGALRLLKAATWVQAQVDAFAGDRAAFREDA